MNLLSSSTVLFHLKPPVNTRVSSVFLYLESEEKEFQIERAQAAAKSALSTSLGSRSGRGGGRGGRSRGRGGRGNRGSSRGGRGGGGRGGNRNHGEGRNGGTSGETSKDAAGEEQAGEKRKRAVEPDGGPDVGIRGTNAPPVLQSTKKAKTDEEAKPAAAAVAA